MATVNEMRCLPRSLKRVRRFDRTIEVEIPKGEDAIHIVEHYLQSKNFQKEWMNVHSKIWLRPCRMYT